MKRGQQQQFFQHQGETKGENEENNIPSSPTKQQQQRPRNVRWSSILATFQSPRSFRSEDASPRSQLHPLSPRQALGPEESGFLIESPVGLDVTQNHSYFGNGDTPQEADFRDMEILFRGRSDFNSWLIEDDDEDKKDVDTNDDQIITNRKNKDLTNTSSDSNSLMDDCWNVVEEEVQLEGGNQHDEASNRYGAERIAKSDGEENEEMDNGEDCWFQIGSGLEEEDEEEGKVEAPKNSPRFQLLDVIVEEEEQQNNDGNDKQSANHMMEFSDMTPDESSSSDGSGIMKEEDDERQRTIPKPTHTPYQSTSEHPQKSPAASSSWFQFVDEDDSDSKGPDLLHLSDDGTTSESGADDDDASVANANDKKGPRGLKTTATGCSKNKDAEENDREHDSSRSWFQILPVDDEDDDDSQPELMKISVNTAHDSGNDGDCSLVQSWSPSSSSSTTNSSLSGAPDNDVDEEQAAAIPIVYKSAADLALQGDNGLNAARTTCQIRSPSWCGRRAAISGNFFLILVVIILALIGSVISLWILTADRPSPSSQPPSIVPVPPSPAPTLSPTRMHHRQPIPPLRPSSPQPSVIGAGTNSPVLDEHQQQAPTASPTSRPTQTLGLGSDTDFGGDPTGRPTSAPASTSTPTADDTPTEIPSAGTSRMPTGNPSNSLEQGTASAAPSLSPATLPPVAAPTVIGETPFPTVAVDATSSPQPTTLSPGTIAEAETSSTSPTCVSSSTRPTMKPSRSSISTFPTPAIATPAPSPNSVDTPSTPFPTVENPSNAISYDDTPWPTNTDEGVESVSPVPTFMSRPTTDLLFPATAPPSPSPTLMILADTMNTPWPTVASTLATKTTTTSSSKGATRIHKLDCQGSNIFARLRHFREAADGDGCNQASSGQRSLRGLSSHTQHHAR